MKKKSELTRQEMISLIKIIIIRFSFFPISLGLLILLPAGTFDYWQVYVYFGILVVPMTFVVFYFLKIDPKFLERRTRAKEKEKQQILISILSTLVFLAGFIIPGLDHRFIWSNVPIYITISADIVILLGYLIIFFVFKQNSYASNIIEVNENQKIISNGFYGIVRHPMYIGVLIMFIPTPIALGSYWGLIPFALLPVSLALRILNEEKVLSNNLNGYKEYCQKTRYRLIPFIW
ncbi:MAG: isoprenylcysteine carboxylmethyltransferase family protein [Bacteroidales bacterium]|nr:isoprenylcysteine carboxylmethyltransferase family protein [Bacteroidales bacterium]